MADTSGGSGGGVSSFLTYSYDQMKEMAHADDPDAISGHAAQWAQAARDLRIFQQMLHEELDSLAGAYSSAAGAPALRQAVSDKTSKLGDVAAKFERNSQAMSFAASALRTARAKLKAIEPEANPETGIAWRDATQMGPMAQQAAPVMDELASAYDLAREQLGFRPGEVFDAPGEISGGNGGLATYVSAPGLGGSGGDGPAGLIPGGRGSPGVGGQPPIAVPGGTPPTGGARRHLRAETDGVLPGTQPGTNRTAGGNGAGTGSSGGAGGARIQMPGARSGMPIGGYRPTAGMPGAGAGAAQAGGSAPGQGGPGGPGRPGAAPPIGHGAAPGGKDRGGRRLTNYERLEPDTFRDARHRTKPVIGEQRRKADTFTPTPGAIGAGSKQTGDTPEPRTPQMPTKEAPKRFEGHEMSVSFNRRPRHGS